MHASLSTRPPLTPARGRWPVLVAGVVLVLAALACGGSAEGVVILEHLPTLTRTPLPTLTPTPNATQVAMAGSGEAEAAIDRAAPQPAAGEANAQAPPVATGSNAAAVSNPDSASSTAPPATAANDAAAQQPQAAAPANTLPPTGTPPPTATAMATVTAVPPTPTETVIPTDTPTPTVTPLPAGWVFSGMHAYPAEALNGMVFYGNLMNNTGGPQQLNEINTTLLDAQGQVIPFEKAIDQWPVRAVPQGGQVPFGVVIPNVQGVADFNFEVQSEPGGDIPREDFEFVDVNSSTEGEEYCLNGRLRNPGGQLQAYLMVTAVLYDGQDQVINYNNAFKSAPKEVVGDETLEVALCVKPHQQEVARYELRAWGL